MMTFHLPILSFPTLRELKRIAKEYGYKKYSLLTRDQLLDLLSGSPPMKVKDVKKESQRTWLKGPFSVEKSRTRSLSDSIYIR